MIHIFSSNYYYFMNSDENGLLFKKILRLNALITSDPQEMSHST